MYYHINNEWTCKRDVGLKMPRSWIVIVTWSHSWMEVFKDRWRECPFVSGLIDSVWKTTKTKQDKKKTDCPDNEYFCLSYRERP